MGSLTVHVVDDEDNPVSGKTVVCHFTTTQSEEVTDDGGVAEFEDVPVCTVDVYVGGEHVEVGVGENDDEDVTVSI
jgi:hypothetical protein